MTVTIPEGSVDSDLFCSVSTDDTKLSPSIKGFTVLAGPYFVNCRDYLGNQANGFKKPLRLSSNIDSKIRSGVSKLSYFGQKDSKWNVIKGSKYDKKTGKEAVVLGDYTEFVAAGKAKKPSPVFIIVIIFLLIAGAIVGLLQFARWRLRQKLEQRYKDYYKKTIGG